MKSLEFQLQIHAFHLTSDEVLKCEHSKGLLGSITFDPPG